MPALVKRRLGSSLGMREALLMSSWPRVLKKSKKVALISLHVMKFMVSYPFLSIEKPGPVGQDIGRWSCLKDRAGLNPKHEIRNTKQYSMTEIRMIRFRVIATPAP
jgi:hypothetical protein